TVRDCFNCGTAPNFGFSKRVEENNYVRSCKWSSNGKWLATESEDRIARIFRLEDPPAESVSLASQVSLGDLVYDTQWHPSLELFATTAKFHPIKLWRPDGGCELTFRGINHLDELTAAYSLGFSLDGRRLYAGYYKTIRIFDLDRPGRQTREIRTFEKGGIGQKAILSCFAMCPTFDGVYAVGSFAGNVGLYSDRTDSCDCLFPTRNEGVTLMEYSADGNYLYVGYRKDSVIQCFDLRFPGQVLHNLERPATTNQRIFFQIDPYDRYLFSGSSTGEVLIHDLKEARPSADLKEPVEAKWRVKASDAAVTGLSLHPGLPLLATTTGQRVFPSPTIEASDHDSEESDVDEPMSNAYISLKRPLDNSMSLWKL
ncbi:WD repeat containingantisense to TP53-like protein, partial [Aphelenchoides avenae]